MKTLLHSEQVQGWTLDAHGLHVVNYKPNATQGEIAEFVEKQLKTQEKDVLFVAVRSDKRKGQHHIECCRVVAAMSNDETKIYQLNLGLTPETIEQMFQVDSRHIVAVGVMQ